MWLHAGQKDTLDLEAGEIILVNKPLDWTSFDVVARLRSLYSIKKIGHAGTLDPKATGLLIICTGKMTKSIVQFSDMEKEYKAILKLGSTTKSFDSETEVIETKEINAVTSLKIESLFTSYIGEQKQIPPMYSAVKINGRRLYKSARKGREVEREARDITIHEFEMTSFNLPYVGFRVVCSKGTYIRSLANDCGIKLGCGAYLTELTRTRIGPFKIEEAYTLETIHHLEQKLQPAVVLQ